ncbi:hypothetical protein AVEN_11119-1 [Araneus ventricosus]|uniref:Uncharacterized protein n=1 Tax=Araneus ventricosus TaxID=182803 RepID=A0A4Y2CR02_ARAVE|nr:hypothetical protein AVEN_11119-1 [Araneus ventricosus]
MRSCRIIKWVLAFPVGTILMGCVAPSSESTFLLREGLGRGRLWQLGLRPQYSTVVQGPWMLRQDRGNTVYDYYIQGGHKKLTLYMNLLRPIRTTNRNEIPDIVI